MSQIFEKQTLRRIILRSNTTVDLSTATNTKILYKKPNGVKGSWTATLSGNDFIFVASSGEIDQGGLWRLQAKGEIGGLTFYSTWVTVWFEIPLDV